MRLRPPARWQEIVELTRMTTDADPAENRWQHADKFALDLSTGSSGAWYRVRTAGPVARTATEFQI